jgi:hypothetical protein
MTVPENLQLAIKERYNAEDVKVISDSPRGVDEVYAYGMLADTTIMGRFPLGDLDELEKTLRDKGEI